MHLLAVAEVFTPVASVVVAVVVAFFGFYVGTGKVRRDLVADVTAAVTARIDAQAKGAMPQPLAIQLQRDFASADGLSRHVQKNERDFAEIGTRIESLRQELQKSAHEREVRAQQRMDAVVEKLGTVTGAVEQIAEHVTELQRQLTETLRTLPRRA